MTRTARGRRGNDGTAKRARASQRPADTSRPPMGASSDQDPPVPAWQALLSGLSVRTRIAALVIPPLLCTLILGSIFFKNALDEASSASRVRDLAAVGLTAIDALTSVQDERDITGMAEAGGTGAGAVSEARAKTDAALATLAEQVDEYRGGDFGSGFERAVVAYDREISRLPDYRVQSDSATPPFDAGGATSYHGVAQSLIGLITAAGAITDDPALARQVASLADIAGAAESASMERGVVAFILTPGQIPTPAQRDQVTVLQGEQNLLLNERFLSGLDDSERARVTDRLAQGQTAVSPARTEISSGAAPVTTKEVWYAGATTNLDSLRQLQRDTAEQIDSRAADATGGARTTAVLTALAVVAVLALTVFLTVVVARSIIGPLRRLRVSALETSKTHLPELVKRIHRDGPSASRDTPHAVAAEGRDEIGQVATAFNDVHSTAVRVASEQALLRQNLDNIVVNLSRRTQSLVDRQLSEIEGLEQRERDPDQLSTLFRIDHMATRVRRHAESLLVLAGVDEMRKHGAAAGVLDVVRTAVGEVEQYPRVKFGVMPTDLIASSAVDDIAHLLAELIDNATEFSAPATPVRVTSQPLLGGGLRLQVTDSGLGIPSAQLAELNERLRNVGDIDVAASRTLGLYVVARLAAKHGIRVRLEPDAEGGTAAQVDLPAHLILSPLDTNEGMAAITPETVAPSTRPAGHEPPVRARGYEPSDLDADPFGLDRDTPDPLVPVASARPPYRDTDTSERPVWPPSGAPQPDPVARVEPQYGEPRSSGGPTVEPLHQEQPSWRSTAATSRHDTNGAGFSDQSRPSSYAPPPSSGPAGPSSLTAPAGSAAGEPPDSRHRAVPDLPEGSSPIFDSVASAWFSQSNTAQDWESPADEGWRRAAEALRSAEEAASARRVQRDTVPIAPPSSHPPSGWARTAANQHVAQAGGPATGEELALSPSGLPVRRRGASLVPGSIADAAPAAAAKRPAAPKDAGNVASTLSSLQRGVGRGREETGGWVPKRPGEDERSNS